MVGESLKYPPINPYRSCYVFPLKKDVSMHDTYYNKHLNKEWKHKIFEENLLHIPVYLLIVIRSFT